MPDTQRSRRWPFSGALARGPQAEAGPEADHPSVASPAEEWPSAWSQALAVEALVVAFRRSGSEASAAAARCKLGAREAACGHEISGPQAMGSAVDVWPLAVDVL